MKAPISLELEGLINDPSDERALVEKVISHDSQNHNETIEIVLANGQTLSFIPSEIYLALARKKEEELEQKLKSKGFLAYLNARIFNRF